MSDLLPWLTRATPVVLGALVLGSGLSLGAPTAAAATTSERQPAQCFVSAYYRRVVTVPGFAKIQATVALPQPVFDPVRDRDREDYMHIYLGGSTASGSEVDAGLVFEITRDANGAIDTVNRAWRPFVRTSSPQVYQNAPAVAADYWYPGEVVRIGFDVVAPGEIRLTVDGAGKHWASAPIPADDFDPRGNQTLKWVFSLDQSGREGKGPVPTRAHVDDAHIYDVTLWTPDGAPTLLTADLVNRARTCIMPSPTQFSIHAIKPFSDEVLSIKGLPYPPG